MSPKGSKPPYKPRVEYRYTLKDVAEAAGMTRNALNVAKVRGKVDPGNFRNMVSFLIRVIIERRLRGNLFALTARGTKRRGRTGSQVSGKKPKKAVHRR